MAYNFSLVPTVGAGMPIGGRGGRGGRGGTVGVVSGGGGYYGLGGGGSLGGAAPRGYNPASGGIPGVTNPLNTITGNMGGITGAIGGITDAQLEALRKQYPTDFFALQQMLLESAKRRAAGDISDLLPEMWQKNAEAALGGGYSGSALENTKRLRDMGLTRLQLEKGAEESMKNVFGTTPTVRPYDPSALIAGLIAAQERADMFNAAPVPEEAYNRARRAAGGGGGGGGGGRGVTMGGGAGAGGGSVDDILRRYGGGGFGPPIIARGTKVPGIDPYAPLPYGSIPYDQSVQSWGGGMDTGDDFGMFGVDEAWAAPTTRENYATYNTQFANMLDPFGGLGGGSYGAGSPMMQNDFDETDFWDTPGTNFGGGLDYGGGAGYYGDEDFLYS